MVAVNSVDKPWLVQKYGGTSLGKLMNTICGSIVPDYTENYRLVIVCSALSGTLKAKGTTSLLLECIALSELGADAQVRMVDLVNLIRDNHLAILDSIFEARKQPALEAYNITKTRIVRECESLKKFLVAAQIVGELSPRAKDRVISLGEKLACIITATCLASKGIPAKPVILDNVVSTVFGASADEQTAALARSGTRFYRAIAEEIATRIRECEPAIPIVTGFFGIMPNSLIQTVGRGYSDLCGALAAVGVGAAELQIWKEVDGIFTADPRKIPSAQLLPSVTADEATELTYYGSEVIHPLTMDQIREANISLRLKNVFKPHADGTLIDPKSNSSDLDIGEVGKVISPPGVLLKNDFSVGRSQRRRPTAVTVKDDILLVNVVCNRNTKSGGLLIQVFDRLERNNIPVDLIATSERNVSFAVHSPGNSNAVLRLEKELESFGQVAIVNHMSIVTIVGHKMRSQIGVANEALAALATANVNLHLISQGASEISISLVVNADDATAALNAIHRDVLKIPTLEESQFRRIVVAAKSTSDAQSVTPFPPDPNSPLSTINTVEREIREAGGEATAIAVDVRDFDSVKRCVDKTVELYGRLDVLVYNSGAIWWAAVGDTPMKRFQLMQRVNPEGLYGAVQASLPHLKKHGNGRIIVAIESGATRKMTEKNPKEAEDLRKATVFSDAILAMLRAPASKVNGRLELDEDYLRCDAGITDFSKYSVVPGTLPRRIMPAQLPDLSVREQDDEGKRMNSAEGRSKL
ncbi:hypothetical protein NUW58_g4112 [Xylaria curta]|uniref:Uncharacterized protein n=1 Tax=Xylaria curta TaxID=42375 RepID=A0ACC1PAE7_9PEZI|nr:hypothetical protein NUW58_g4112 [Xylaria curta]